MAIKISGTTVIDDSRNLTNINSGAVLGIQSGGQSVGAGATTLNFIGTGNTFAYDPGTKTLNISIQGDDSVLGIQSGGQSVGAGATTLNFIGTGNTFAYNAGTKTLDISIAGGGGGSGVSSTGVSTAAIWSNPSFISTSYTLDEGTNNYGVFGPVSVAVGATIIVGAGNTFVIV